MNKMKKIHLKGLAENMRICEQLTDNYDLGVSFDFEEESIDVIPNVLLSIYECPDICELEKAMEYNLRKEFGDLSLVGQDYGYSEYTIEGFNVNNATIGGHNIQDIIDSKKGKYLHITLEQVGKTIE